MRLGTGITARTELPDRCETCPVDSDLEPSFTLNLFPDGYSVGELGKGMLLYLIGDDPNKRPYSKAPKAFFSDIEHGFMPQDILHGVHCKFQNGSTVCEVRDYRSVFSNGGDCSGEDFPKVHRVHLRLGTECVVKDLSSLADASWTYQDQLTAESIILSTLQPRLNLDPTPCLEILCNSSAKKIDLGLNKERQQNKDASVLIMPTNSPENCKSKEFNVRKGAAVCIDNATIQGVSNESNEQQAQVEILSVDCQTEETQSVTVLSQKIKKPSSLQHERHESQICSPPNKTGRSNSPNSKGPQKSADSSNKEGVDQGSQNGMHVDAKIGQEIANKDMKAQKQLPLSMHAKDPCTSLGITNLCIERTPEKVRSFHMLKQNHEDTIQFLNNSGMVHVKDSRIPSATLCSGSSTKATCKPLKGMEAKKSQHIASKRNTSKISSNCSNQEINLEVRRQKKVYTHINRRLWEPAVTGGVRSQVDIDLELGRGRKQTIDASHLQISANVPEHCKPNEFNVCKVATVRSENSALEGMPSVNGTKSIVESDPGRTIQSSSTLTNSSAICDRKDSESPTPAPDYLLQSNCERALVTASQVDYENRQLQRVTIVPQKRKKSLKLLNERHESKNHCRPNKTGRFSQNFMGQKSTGSKNKEPIVLGSPERLQLKVMVGQTIGNTDIKDQKQVPLSMHPSDHLCTSLNTSYPCIEKIPEKVISLPIRLKEQHKALIVDLKNSGTAYLEDSGTPSVASFSASSCKAASEPGEDKELIALSRKVKGNSTISLNQEVDLNGKMQQNVHIPIKPPCEIRSLEPAVTGVSCKFEFSSHFESCSRHPTNNTEDDIEKILSEVILTTQRHGLNKKAAKSDTETSWLLPPYKFFLSENDEEVPYTRKETMTYYVPGISTSTWKIRKLTFHPSRYLSCNGLVDDNHYTLCLLESQDDHQITVGTIYEDEPIHIATLPTSGHAEKFADQFISLMKRDGYNLCNDVVCSEPSELRQKSEYVSHLGYLTGECAEYHVLSPSAMNSLSVTEKNDVGFTFQNRLPYFHATLLQPVTQQQILTEQLPSLESPEAVFLNSSHPGNLHHTGRILQEQGSSSASDTFAMNLHQFPPVDSSQDVFMDQSVQCRDNIPFGDTYGMSMSRSRFRHWRHEFPTDQYWQYSHDVPGFSGSYCARSASGYSQRCNVPFDQFVQYPHNIPEFSDTYGAGKSASSYGQWRQIYTTMGSVVYQWDLPAFVRRIHNSPPLHHDETSIPWSEFRPMPSLQMSSGSMSDYNWVTSTMVPLPIPLGYQYLSHGMC